MSTMAALLLVIRVFDRSGLSEAHRTAAVRAADEILHQAGITSTWVDCSPGARPVSEPACTLPLAVNELVLRVTPAMPAEPEGTERALGYSYVEPDAGRGTLGTVFSDRVAWLAAAARTRATTVLGRAMAHEIGHLLIGTSEHSPRGLMRQVWSADDLVRNRQEDWLFSADDRARIHDSRIADWDPSRLADAAGKDATSGAS